MDHFADMLEAIRSLADLQNYLEKHPDKELDAKIHRVLSINQKILDMSVHYMESVGGIAMIYRALFAFIISERSDR